MIFVVHAQYNTGGAVSMLLLVLESRIIAPLVDTPPRPPVTDIPMIAVTLATLKAELEVSAACFADSAVNTLDPDTVNEELQTAAPST